MTGIDRVTLDVPDPEAARAYYDAAFGLGDVVALRASQAPSTGFRGFVLSLVVARPGTVDSLTDTAVGNGGTVLKPVTKSFWGYGGVVRAPDGTIWKIATSAKKDDGPPNRQVDQVVLLLGAADVKASKRFYADRGLKVARSFGSKYVEFDTGSRVKLALYGRRAAAKDAGVAAEGTGSHRLVIGGDLGGAAGGAVTDPDGFVWEAAPVPVRAPGARRS